MQLPRNTSVVMARESITGEFRLDKDTKNTRRFEEVVEVEQGGETVEVPAEGLGQHAIGTIYVQREELQKAFDELPDHIKVEITVSDGD